jgi:hypothetical protein
VNGDQGPQPPRPAPAPAEAPPQVTPPVSAAVEPKPDGSSTEWEVQAPEGQDRWTLSIPANTLQARYLKEYERMHGEVPASLDKLPKLPKYVKVTATGGTKRKKRSVLRTESIPGGGEQLARIASAAFGSGVTGISLKPSRRWRFLLARLSTPANRLNTAAVFLGAASAVITAVLTLVIGPPRPGQGPSGPILAFGVAAAVSAFLAPLLALASSTWFSD